MMGLGNFGSKDDLNAKLKFNEVLKEDVSHLGAAIHKKMIINTNQF